MGWEDKRLTVLIAGDSGSGKTFLIANVPNALIYDTDLGGGAGYLEARIAKNGSERIECGSFQDLLADLEKRNANKTLSKFNSLVIDHVTALHQESQLRWNPGLKTDFGKSNEAATKEWRKIREFCRDFDFNLFATAHTKQKYVNEVPVGDIADGAKNLPADFGIVLHLAATAKYPSTAIVKKWRRDPEDPRGAIPPSFQATYDEICKIAGIKTNAPRSEKTGASVPKLEQKSTVEIHVQEKPVPMDKPGMDLTLRQIQECLGEFAVNTKLAVEDMKKIFLEPLGIDQSRDIKPEQYRPMLSAILGEYSFRNVPAGLHPKLNARIKESSNV